MLFFIAGGLIVLVAPSPWDAWPCLLALKGAAGLWLGGGA